MAPNSDAHPSVREGFSFEVQKYTSVTAHEGTHSISKNIPLSEVNRHCVPEDCWVALNGKARRRGASEDLKVIQQGCLDHNSVYSMV